MPYLSKKEYCSVFPGIPMKEISLPDGTTSKRAIDINGNTLSAADTYKLWNKEYKKWEKECNTKKSPKRRSTKRKSPKRKSPKRKSPKRKSSKRKSSKRKSPKRSSKRRSTRRKSPRRASPIRKMRKYYPTFVGKRFQKFERPSSMPRYAAAPGAAGPAPPASAGPAPAPASDKISAKGFNLTRIEHDIMNLRVKADKYMYLAIVNMDIELYNVAVYHGGVFPKANVTFLAVDEFIRDMQNLRLIEGSVIGGWKNVDYKLLEEILKSFSEKDLNDYWFKHRESEAYMTFALGQEDKTAVQWLLKNNKYTNEQLELFTQLPWVKPELKELLKPTTFMGALVAMTGGFFF